MLPFVLSVWFFVAYDHAAGGFQFIEKIPWVVPFGISYHLGVDGINSLLLLLLGIVFPLCCFNIRSPSKNGSKNITSFCCITTIGAYGAFLSLDIFFFYFFHEIVTIPVFLMIAIWGSDRKEHAAMKLTLYLTAGAALSLIGLIALYHAVGLNTFDFIQIQQYLALHPLPIALAELDFSAYRRRFWHYAHPLAFLYLGARRIRGRAHVHQHAACRCPQKNGRLCHYPFRHPINASSRAHLDAHRRCFSDL